MKYVFFVFGISIHMLLILNTSVWSDTSDRDRESVLNNNLRERESSLDFSAREKTSEASSEENAENEINLLEIFIPPEKDKPQNTEAGGTRNGNSCLARQPNIKSLMPENNYGLTLQKRPQIYLYLPGISSDTALLSLINKTDDSYQQAIVTLNKDQEDLATINIPNSFSSLMVENIYLWSISIICDRVPHPSDPILSGWIERVESSATLQQKLQQKDWQEKIAWYGEHGFWYDMLSAIPSNNNLWLQAIEQFK